VNILAAGARILHSTPVKIEFTFGHLSIKDTWTNDQR